MNVAAVISILCFVALQRNKSIDLSAFFIRENHLKGAFDTMCQQSVLLSLFSASVILSLWNMELLVEATSVYIAFECSIIINLC